MFIQEISEHTPFGKGMKVFEADPKLIDLLYQSKYVDIPDDCPFELYPNQPLVLKHGKQSALAIVNPKANGIILADGEITHFGVKGRNKEQRLLLNLLANDDIQLIVVTGPAGSGKTTCLGAFALDQITKGAKGAKGQKLILSKPLETVGKGRFLGTVPGSMDEKFAPFLLSYTHMFEGLVKDPHYLEMLMKKKVIEFIPLELMRGSSLRNTIAWYDESQTLDYHEMETLGSRIDDNQGKSKLILSGDLNQRDRRISKEKTGLHRLVSSRQFLESPFTASIQLTENERGPISQLFFDVFNEDREE